jgi:hypothetical protein
LFILRLILLFGLGKITGSKKERIMVDRIEEVVFGMKFDRALVEQHLDDVQVIDPNFKRFLDSDGGIDTEVDTLSINYRLVIQYIGRVCDVMRAMRRVMSVPGVVKSVDVNELKHQECLIFELFKDMERIRLICQEEQDVSYRQPGAGDNCGDSV